MRAPAPAPTTDPMAAPAPGLPTALPMMPPTAAPPRAPIPAPFSRLVKGVEQPVIAIIKRARVKNDKILFSILVPF